jgi:hypothetical protein
VLCSRAGCREGRRAVQPRGWDLTGSRDERSCFIPAGVSSQTPRRSAGFADRPKEETSKTTDISANSSRTLSLSFRSECSAIRLRRHQCRTQGAFALDIDL